MGNRRKVSPDIVFHLAALPGVLYWLKHIDYEKRHCSWRIESPSCTAHRAATAFPGHENCADAGTKRRRESDVGEYYEGEMSVWLRFEGAVCRRVGPDAGDGVGART